MNEQCRSTDLEVANRLRHLATYWSPLLGETVLGVNAIVSHRLCKAQAHIALLLMHGYRETAPIVVRMGRFLTVKRLEQQPNLPVVF